MPIRNFYDVIFSNLPVKNDIGARIKSIREFIGFTQADLAKRASISRKTIVKLENHFNEYKRGYNRTRLLEKIALVLSQGDWLVTVLDILGEQEPL